MRQVNIPNVTHNETKVVAGKVSLGHNLFEEMILQVKFFWVTIH